MINFEDLNEIKFNMDIMWDEARMSLIETFNAFCIVHGGERWTGMLICLLYNKMGAVARRYGYKFVSTRDKTVLYIQVVCA